MLPWYSGIYIHCVCMCMCMCLCMCMCMCVHAVMYSVWKSQLHLKLIKINWQLLLTMAVIIHWLEYISALESTPRSILTLHTYMSQSKVAWMS